VTNEDEIRTLIYRYSECLDSGDFASLAKLFTHAEFNLDGPFGLVLHGEDELRAHFERIVRVYDGSPCCHHVMTNIVVDVDEGRDVASARSYITVYQAVPPDFPLQVILSGRIHDEFERVDGTWRYTLRHPTAELIGDVSHHLKDIEIQAGPAV
jgi:ketosteroid isomerase-like protein